MTIYAAPCEKGVTKKNIQDAIDYTKKEHPGWDLTGVEPTYDGQGIIARNTHHMKKKVREICEKALELHEIEIGIQTFVVSIAVDARVDAKVKGRTLEDAMAKARNGLYDYTLEDAEVISSSPVNISNPDGVLIADF